MESEYTSSPQPLADIPTQPAEKQLLAPVWHTILIAGIMLANSYLAAKLMASKRGSPGVGKTRIGDYVLTIGFELFLLLLVWVGLRFKSYKIRDLIGGKWSSPEDFLMDVGIAIGFWVVSFVILAALAYLLGQMSAPQVSDMKQRLAALAPRSVTELAFFVSLSVVAGFVEEIIFRGYLQRQIGAIFGNIYVGLALSAVIFGASHGYEGIRNMIRICIFGALFGALAMMRKSLRPGMMAHAVQDGLAGIGMYVVSRSGKF
jgi:uncharacterized protein